ncbi:MAG: agmatine deiminase family protein [Pseudomonadota bacterium]
MQRREVLLSAGAAGVIGLANPSVSQSPPSLQVPPEDAPHARTFMQWPASRRVYRDRFFLDLVQQTIADIANTLAAFEPVAMLADASLHDGARRRLSDAVELWDIPTEDLWCRDAGPIFAKTPSGGRAVTHIQFNGWGNRQVHEADGQIAQTVAERLGLALVPSGLVGEGGGIEHDGHGVLLAHESSWVNDNRNPGLTRDEIETRLLNAYGAERMIWSPGVWGEDITDYHIDSLARFTRPGRVLVNLPQDPDRSDPFHVAAAETHERLIAAGLDVEVIPEPRQRRVDSVDFVAAYVNYYVCNGAVITAEFGDAETDQIAREALGRHFPGREVVMLNVDPLGELGGGIHCATQQMPAV